MSEAIKVIVKRPFEPVGRVRIIPNTLEALQDMVGGHIETVTFASDMVIICNEEGRLAGPPENCSICGVDFVGTIVVAGTDGEEFTDVPTTLENWEELWLS